MKNSIKQLSKERVKFYYEIFKPSEFFILDMFGEKRPLMHKWIQDLTKISSFNNENSSIFAADELITWGKSLDFLEKKNLLIVLIKN